MTRWVLLIAAVMRTPPISEFHPFSGSCWRYKHSLVQLLSHLAVVIKMVDGINYQPEPSKVKFALMLAFFFFFSFVSLPRIVLKKSSRHWVLRSVSDSSSICVFNQCFTVDRSCPVRHELESACHPLLRQEELPHQIRPSQWVSLVCHGCTHAYVRKSWCGTSRFACVFSSKAHWCQRSADGGLTGSQTEEESRHFHPAHGRRDAAGRRSRGTGCGVCYTQPGKRLSLSRLSQGNAAVDRNDVCAHRKRRSCAVTAPSQPSSPVRCPWPGSPACGVRGPTRACPSSTTTSPRRSRSVASCGPGPCWILKRNPGVMSLRREMRPKTESAFLL